MHRIGCKGRAGKMGTATAFFTEKNLSLAKPLLELLAESNQNVPNWLVKYADLERGDMQGRKWRSNGRLSGHITHWSNNDKKIHHLSFVTEFCWTSDAHNSIADIKLSSSLVTNGMHTNFCTLLYWSCFAAYRLGSTLTTLKAQGFMTWCCMRAASCIWSPKWMMMSLISSIQTKHFPCTM